MVRLVLALLFSAIPAASERLPYRVFNTANSLVRNTVTRLRRDPKGYLWICTEEGLSLFDGLRFIDYTVEDGLPDRRVNDILPARDGTYWLATGSGVFRFRPRSASMPGQRQRPWFSAVPLRDMSGSHSFRVLLEDRRGVVWAGGRSGLYRLQANSGVLEPVPLHPLGSSVLTIYEDEMRQLVGTTDGLYRYSDRSGNAVRLFVLPDVWALHMFASRSEAALHFPRFERYPKHDGRIGGLRFHATRSSAAPRFLGFTTISTSCPSATRKRISRSTE